MTRQDKERLIQIRHISATMDARSRNISNFANPVNLGLVKITKKNDKRCVELTAKGEKILNA